MKMVQVKNGEIIKYSLPKVGILSNGRTVSGYHLLEETVLKSEGWLPLEDVKPIYDMETQQLINDGYNILIDKVQVKYIVESIPVVEDISQTPSTEERLDALEMVLLMLL